MLKTCFAAISICPTALLTKAVCAAFFRERPIKKKKKKKEYFLSLFVVEFILILSP